MENKPTSHHLLQTTQELEIFCCAVQKQITHSKNVQMNRQIQEKLFMAIDTEFHRQHTYWPQVCLIQIAMGDEIILIDPLSKELSLQPLLSLLDDPDLVKVFHSSRQDLEIFWKEFNRLPSPLFDTQVGALFLGYGDSISYDVLVEKMLSISLDKSQQFTDWLERPLSHEQITYALGDVIYLQKLYPQMISALADQDRLSWAEEETNHLLSPEIYAPDPMNAWRRIKNHHQFPKNTALVQEIAAWRESTAQDLDVNRGRLIRDEILLSLASHPPKTIEGLRLKTSSTLLDHKLPDELMSVIEKALHRPEHTWPSLETHIALTVPQRKRFEHLREFIHKKAQELGLPPRILAGRRHLEIYGRTGVLPDYLQQGWRAQMFKDWQK